MHVIKRLETKYELDLAAAEVLSVVVSRHLRPYEYRKGFPFTYVTTVYFDTDRLKFFRRAVRSSDDNVKIRLREYSYRPSPDEVVLLPYCFLEIKRRIQGRVVKQRLRVSKGLVSRLLAGEEIWRDLVASDTDRDRDLQREVYLDLRRFLEDHQLHPRSVIEYRRRVYQSDDGDVRITFDDELAIYPPPEALYIGSDTISPRGRAIARRKLTKVIMEVKSSRGHPGWLNRVLGSFVPSRISKFTESMSVLAN